MPQGAFSRAITFGRNLSQMLAVPVLGDIFGGNKCFKKVGFAVPLQFFPLALATECKSCYICITRAPLPPA
jgi:hypothetical protein